MIPISISDCGHALSRAQDRFAKAQVQFLRAADSYAAAPLDETLNERFLIAHHHLTKTALDLSDAENRLRTARAR